MNKFNTTWTSDGITNGYVLFGNGNLVNLGKITKPTYGAGWMITIPGLPKSWFNMSSQFGDVVFHPGYERAMSKVPYPLRVRSKAVAEEVILHVRAVMAEHATDWFYSYPNPENK